ncbi:UNVERIFIED_CONTAM: hypothetical protein HDU68_008877, partial [Siphonaria sp. JEL0065]
MHDEPACFICGSILPKGAVAINQHIDLCLSRAESGSPSSTSPSQDSIPKGRGKGKGKLVKSEPTSLSSSSAATQQEIYDDAQQQGEVEFEEYTWAGQTRVRVTSMLEGGFAAHGFNVYNKKRDKDVEEDIDIDMDEEEMFGGVQFTNEDVGRFVAVKEQTGEESGDGAQTGSSSPVPYDGGDEDEDVDVEEIDISKAAKTGNPGELDSQEKLTKSGLEIDTLLKELEHHNELNYRLKSANGVQRSKIENLEVELEHKQIDRLEITSDMSRQYKSMQSEMTAKINSLEAQVADLKAKLSASQTASQESTKEFLRIIAIKDEVIEEQNVKMSYMSSEFESMLN